MRRRIGLSLSLAAALAATALAPAPAVAQIDAPITDPLGAVDAWATAQSLRRLLPDGTRAGRASRTSARHRRHARKPTRAQTAKLRFRRNPRVTAANVQAVVTRFGPGHDPAIISADIERNRRLAHRHMRSLPGRWNPNDLADIAAYVLLSGYAAYTDRTSLPGRAVLTVKHAARDGLASRKRVRRTASARKQTAAEMSEIRMIYSLAALGAARAAGDGDAAEETRWEMRTWVREVYGLDLERARLTRRGFVVR
jgi:hypothetical protein